MADARHHTAARCPQPVVVFVPVPTAGSPQPLKWAKPAPYKRNQPTNWRPANRPPNRKAFPSLEMMLPFP